MSVETFFVEQRVRVAVTVPGNVTREIHAPNLVINDDVKLDAMNVQEAANYLVEVIRFWRTRGGIFCVNEIDVRVEGRAVELPEDEWSFMYKTPSTHDGCVRSQRILDKIFGGRWIFNALPFVRHEEDRVHTWKFGALKSFAEHGPDHVVK